MLDDKNDTIEELKRQMDKMKGKDQNIIEEFHKLSKKYDK